MELVDGRTLREMLADGPLPVERVLALARQMADGLETREDIDSGKVAFYGFSTAIFGTIFTAVDDRFKASVLLSAGLMPDEQLPEMDFVNFAPRSRVPTLMINGRDDFIFPVDTLQKLLFDWLGAPEADKRHVLLDGGHLPPDRRAIIREVLGWLDRYLGPVTPAGTVGIPWAFVGHPRVFRGHSAGIA